MPIVEFLLYLKCFAIISFSLFSSLSPRSLNLCLIYEWKELCELTNAQHWLLLYCFSFDFYYGMCVYVNVVHACVSMKYRVNKDIWVSGSVAVSHL